MKSSSLYRLALLILSYLFVISGSRNLAHGQSVPFVVRFWYPMDGRVFVAPANVDVHAQVLDSNLVETVEYFSGDTSLGILTNKEGLWLTNTWSENSFFLLWSNVMATSPPIHIYVVTNLPPVVRICARPCCDRRNQLRTMDPSGTQFTNTATFVVYRDGATNKDLKVSYTIGGTATNGADYATIPDTVTIPAAKRYALITILPLSDGDSAYRHYDTVVLALTKPVAMPPGYRVGSPDKAAAVILEENVLPILHPMVHSLSEGTTHVSLPATNGMNFSLQISSDLVNWLPICTNTVLKGSAQFVDPDSSAGANRFYRIVPVVTPVDYPLSKLLPQEASATSSVEN